MRTTARFRLVFSVFLVPAIEALALAVGQSLSASFVRRRLPKLLAACVVLLRTAPVDVSARRLAEFRRRYIQQSIQSVPRPCLCRAIVSGVLVCPPPWTELLPFLSMCLLSSSVNLPAASYSNFPKFSAVFSRRLRARPVCQLALCSLLCSIGSYFWVLTLETFLDSRRIPRTTLLDSNVLPL